MLPKTDPAKTNKVVNVTSIARFGWVIVTMIEGRYLPFSVKAGNLRLAIYNKLQGY